MTLPFGPRGAVYRRLVLLIAVTALSACDERPMAAKSPAPRPALTVMPSESPAQGPKEEQINDMEEYLLDLFEAIGVPGQIDEHGFGDAKVAGPWKNSEIVVHAFPPESAEFVETKIEFSGTRRMSGVEVRHGESPAFGVMYVFACEDITYEVWTRGGGGGTIRSFLKRFLGPACNGSR